MLKINLSIQPKKSRRAKMVTPIEWPTHDYYQAIEMNQLIPWTPELVDIVSLKFDGVGPGELALALAGLGKSLPFEPEKACRHLMSRGIIGGQAQSFDLTFDKESSRIPSLHGTWEVKQPDQNMEIRPGTLGMELIEQRYRSFALACDQMEAFMMDLFSRIRTPDFEEFTFQAHQILGAKTYSRLRAFIFEGANFSEPYVLGSVRKIRSGELSIGRALGCVASDRGQQFGLLQAIRAMNLLVKSSPAPVVQNLARRHLASTLFDDPDHVIDIFTSMADPSKIFDDVSGLILVSRQGFYVMPRASFDKQTLTFSRISQRKPRIKVGIDLGQVKEQNLFISS